ncbi:MAG: YbaN family protein [Gemmatimonadota bacterium]|nr:YbaN family protein [Gemmatimonadota bacterium]
MEAEIVQSERQMAKSRATRLGWILIGHVFLGVGLLGTVIPLLPTTVFLLLAAASYARGSERFYTYLMDHRVFGRLINDWNQHRAMSAGAKRWAIGSVLISITVSTIAVDLIWLRVVLVVIAVFVIAKLLRIPTREDG